MQSDASNTPNVQPSVEGVTEQLPVVVYGTLRPGQGNYERILAGRTLSERTVVITGYRMYSNHLYPFVVPHPDGPAQIVGELITVPEAEWEQVLWDLDALEGYDGPGSRNLYDRVVVKVSEDGREFDAYLYVAHESLHAEILFDMPHITSGDWTYRNNN